MYLDKCKTTTSTGKTYYRVLLRDSYRQNGKVKHQTYGNLSKCSPEIIEAIELALKNKDKLPALINNNGKYGSRQGKSCGAVLLLYQLAQRLGIIKALGNNRNATLALWQVFARVIDQGSRLSAVRLAQYHGACDILQLDQFNEDDLYENLDWLAHRQTHIENALFTHSHPNNENADLFLYDVTSSYFEGDCNELAAFGYNRDGKKGKKQIVIGLLTDKTGEPVSVQVFSGNTIDTKTFKSQVDKVRSRFGNGEVTFVGDRGMIKSPQMEDLSDEQLPYHYITAITKPQIEKLLKDAVIQLDLFDDSINEVITDDSIRYILRRNPTRAAEMRHTRNDKKHTIQRLIDKKNQYLSEHPRAGDDVAQKEIIKKIKQLHIDSWINVEVDNHRLHMVVDTEKLAEVEKLDGCYVIKTDLMSDAISADDIHDRYKDLSMVERVFRFSKTVHLEIRPVNVRKEHRTRGHVLVVMLAMKLRLELERVWRDLNMTVEDGIKETATLCFTEVIKNNKSLCNTVPQPRYSVQELLDAAHIKLPEVVPYSGVVVATRKKLTERRNRL